MDALSSPDNTNAAKRATSARWLIVIAYFAATFIGAWLLSGYLARVGDTQNVSNLMWLLFGPMIALAMVHGLVIYILTSTVVLPLLLASVGSAMARRTICLCSAAIVWVAIGHWMYAG